MRLKPETVDSIIKSEFHDKAAKELDLVKQLGGDVLILDDGSYPALLREIDDPPPVLYVRGDWQACFDLPTVGVVGSRMCSTYGENASEMLSRDLASRGICVVSGLARGIDTAAHRGAMRGQGKTVAVMGTGIDAVYPKENAGLVREILESGGAVVSQFPLGTPPLTANFPKRNRIISGLSQGTLVVEAALRSGSLITARMAVEQGKDVFAIPGSIHSPQSRGCHALIKQGAKLVEVADDVLEELRLGDPPLRANHQQFSPASDHKTQSRSASVENSPSDSALLTALGHDPVSLDALQARTGLATALLQAELMALELQGQLVRLPGGLFQRMSAA